MDYADHATERRQCNPVIADSLTLDFPTLFDGSVEKTQSGSET